MSKFTPSMRESKLNAFKHPWSASIAGAGTCTHTAQEPHSPMPVNTFSHNGRKSKSNAIEHPRSTNAGRAGYTQKISRAQLRLIHTAKRVLNLSDAQYRDLLEEHCGVRSAKELRTHAQVQTIMNAFYAQGFESQKGDEAIGTRRIRAVRALEKEAELILGNNWHARLRGACNYCFAFYEYEACTFEQIRRLRGFITKTHKRAGGMK